MDRLRALLRVLAMLLLGTAGAFNLMGGIGTSCIAFAAERFGPRMAVLAPYRWAYVLFVIAGTATALWEIKALWDLARRRAGAGIGAIWSLAAGAAVAGIHAATSFALRGSAAPADWRFYLTLLALLAFMGLRFAGVFADGDTVASEGQSPDAAASDPGASVGPALIAMSLVALTIQHLMASTHTIDGVNYGDVWHLPLLVCGAAGLGAAGWLMVGRRILRSRAPSLGDGSGARVAGSAMPAGPPLP